MSAQPTPIFDENVVAAILNSRADGATFDLILSSLSPQHMPSFEEAKRREEIDLTTADPEALGLNVLDDADLLDAIDEAKRKAADVSQPTDGKFATPLDGALWMASKGVPQIPLRPRAKAAFLKGWENLATTDPAQIRRWAAEYPNCNFGSVGKRGKHFVFEADSSEVRVRYEATGNTFTSKLIVQSRLGRGHRWYLFADGVENISQAYTKFQDFSVRADDQYCVSPGSIHPETGEQYTVVVAGTPEVPTASEIAFWNSERVEKKSSEPAGDILKDASGLIPHGAIHGAMLTQAGKYRALGMNAELIESALLDWVHTNCAPPIDDDKVKTMARSICNFPEGENKDLVLTQTPLAITPETANPILTINGDDFMVEKIPPRKVLISTISANEPVIFEQSINQVFAWRGAGKTCLGMGFVQALATGGSFLNFKAHGRSRVLYVEGELPDSQFQERWRSIVGKTNGYAYMASIDKQEGHHYVSLATEIGMAKIEATLADLRSRGVDIKVLMLDNISTLFNVKANEEEVWIGIQSWFTSLRSRGITVFFFHHAGKGGLSRSHSKSEDMLDVSIKLEAPDDPEQGHLHSVLTFDKARAGLSEKPAEIKLHRTHSPQCACGGEMGVFFCSGDGVRWEHIPQVNKKAEAYSMFSVGATYSQVADNLGVPVGTAKTWRTKWGKEQQQQDAGRIAAARQDRAQG